MYQLMNKICSVHYKRGEKVKEFNLSPFYYKTYVLKFKHTCFTYRGGIVPIVSEGWTTLDGYDYLELNTSIGVQYVQNFTYKI